MDSLFAHQRARSGYIEQTPFGEKLGFDGIDLNSMKEEEVNSLLQTHGILPTLDEAKAVFYSLGDDYWKILIDGEYHHLNSQLVFDLGLHGNQQEPGYWDSLNAAAELLWNDPYLKMDVYRNVHRTACRHFEGAQNHTACKASDSDRWRSGNQQVTYLSDAILDTNGSRQFKYMVGSWSKIKKCLDSDPSSSHLIKMKGQAFIEQTLNEFKSLAQNIATKSLPIGIEASLLKLRRDHFAMIWSPSDMLELEEENHKICEALKQINGLFVDMLSSESKDREDLLQSLLLYRRCFIEDNSKFIIKSQVSKVRELVKQIGVETEIQENVEVMSTGDGYIVIKYPDSRHVQDIITKLMDAFNTAILMARKDALLALQKGKIALQVREEYQATARKLISDFYAKMEIEHPFIDGNGRTHILFQNVLLCMNGLHPCILDNPYYADAHSLEESELYLRKGLERFEQVFLKTHRSALDEAI